MTRAGRAAQIWPILTKHAKNRQTLNYGKLYDLMGKGAPPPHALGSFLEYVARYCKTNGLPPLDTILVSSAPADAARLEAVFDYDWDSVPVPTAARLDATFRGR